MDFFNEQIPEADKARIDWSKFKAYPFSDPHRPWKWTVDREREVFLVALDQFGHDDNGTRPDIYAFYWKGEVIRFEAKCLSTGVFETGVTMDWKISNIDIPSNLEIQRQEILASIREAIDAHGAIYRRESIKTVHIDIL